MSTTEKRKRLFGTDGIRGVAGEYPLDDATVQAFGLAVGQWVRRLAGSTRVLIGMDTRESSPRLAQLVAAGLNAAGARPVLAGVLPTPAVAWLTRAMDFGAGVVISASHNPYRDNGLKVFTHSGFKLPDEEEAALEEQIHQLRGTLGDPGPGQWESGESLTEAYLDWLVSVSPRVDGWSIGVDAGHGAAYQLAPQLLKRLGASAWAIGCEPDGRNINAGYGALYPQRLAQEVVRRQARLGVAFDGDADRAIFVSHTGRVVDGDHVLYLCARWLARRGELAPAGRQPVVVATVMSNFALEKKLAELGIRLIRTRVGDKYVLEEMLRSGAVLGGEQSGHIIFLRYATTGDGLLTLSRVLEILVETGKELDELASELQPLPQHLINVRLERRLSLEEMPGLAAAIRRAEEELGGQGRIVVRPSGTEPVLRVMVEAPQADLAERLARQIAAEAQASSAGLTD